MDGLSGSRPEWEISLGVDVATGPDENTEASELQSLLNDIRHIITSLYNISSALRDPVPRERLAKFATIDVSHFKPWDIDHIRHKFPGAPEYLVKRLGEANSKRRQLLQYYKNHHDGLAQYTILPLSSNEDCWLSASRKTKAACQLDISTGDEGLGSAAAYFESDIATGSTAPQPQTPEAAALDEPESDDDILPGAFYITSTNINEYINIQVPPPPSAESAFNGEPFQCPYCYQIIKIRNLPSWR